MELGLGTRSDRSPSIAMYTENTYLQINASKIVQINFLKYRFELLFFVKLSFSCIIYFR
jgi:hypothetical protein